MYLMHREASPSKTSVFGAGKDLLQRLNKDNGGLFSKDLNLEMSLREEFSLA